MRLHPQQVTVYTLTDEKEEMVALIKDRRLYHMEPLDDEGIARLFNGGNALPLVASALNRES